MKTKQIIGIIMRASIFIVLAILYTWLMIYMIVHHPAIFAAYVVLILGGIWLAIKESSMYEPADSVELIKEVTRKARIAYMRQILPKTKLKSTCQVKDGKVVTDDYNQIRQAGS